MTRLKFQLFPFPGELQWQTKKLLEFEVSRDEWTVYVRPELVAEIAYSDLQESPRYPGGLALWVARVMRYRKGKSSNETDTIQKIWQIFKAKREKRLEER